MHTVSNVAGESSRVNLEPSEGEDRARLCLPGPCEVQLLRVFPELVHLERQI